MAWCVEEKNEWTDCVSLIRNHGEQKTVAQVLTSPERKIM